MYSCLIDLTYGVCMSQKSLSKLSFVVFERSMSSGSLSVCQVTYLRERYSHVQTMYHVQWLRGYQLGLSPPETGIKFQRWTDFFSFLDLLTYNFDFLGCTELLLHTGNTFLLNIHVCFNVIFRHR